MKKSLILLLGATLSFSALADFSRYSVLVVNKYWDDQSFLKLESFAPNLYPKDYCPQPSSVHGYSNEMFIYGGSYCAPSSKAPTAGPGATVTYTLHGADGKPILTCQMNYSYVSGICSASTPDAGKKEWQPGVARCNANANFFESTGVCAITFMFYPAVAHKGG